MKHHPPPTMMVPVDLAEELAKVRRELAEVKDLLAGRDTTTWMTVTEAAKKYRVSESTVNRWVREGSFIAQGTGKNRRVTPQDTGSAS